MNTRSTFEVLSAGPNSPARWNGSLIRLLQVCRELVSGMNADIRAGLLPDGFCARSDNFHHATFGDLTPDVLAVLNDYPLSLESPFEGVSTISGGVWNAADLDGGNDALLKLKFEAGTLDLPFHSHDHSDRVVFVADGAGTFQLATDRAANPPELVEVTTGDILIFARQTVHTFATPKRALTLLSYHSPFVPLDHQGQYTLHRWLADCQRDNKAT